MDLKYIATVLFSLLHELGHAKCILKIAKYNKYYNATKYVVIAFGDYQNGKLLFSWFYPHFLCHKKKSDIRICFFSTSSTKSNPITLSSYYAKLNRQEIIACAKAGYKAELHCFIITAILVCVLLISCPFTQLYFITFALGACFTIIACITGFSYLFAHINSKQVKSKKIIRNDYYYAKYPKRFNKKWKAYTYNKLRYSLH